MKINEAVQKRRTIVKVALVSASVVILSAILYGIAKGIYMAKKETGYDKVEEEISWSPPIIPPSSVFGEAARVDAAGVGSVADTERLTPEQMKEVDDLVDEFVDDIFHVVYFQMAREHQNFLNGCFLYDTLKGTMTKVKVLSCGSVVLDDTALDTCSLLGNYSSMDSWKASCPDNTFVPCLNESCTSIVYKDTEPTVPSNVTKQNACTASEEAPCSSLCRTDAFQLESHLELICVNVDLATAYVDLIDAMGYDVKEFFQPLASPRRPLSTAIKIGFAVVILGMLSALGWMWYQRRRWVRSI